MAKLKNSYVTWKNGEIKVVTKKPKQIHCEGFFDPADFDTSDPRSLFLLWYTTLTVGLWEVPKMKTPSNVYNELIHEIDEFAEIDDLDFFTADHDVSWRNCKRTTDEASARFTALQANALEKGKLPISGDPVQVRLDTARQFTESWNDELNVIMDEWDSPMWRAAVAELADLFVQWLNNTEAADSRFRDWILQRVKLESSSEAEHGHTRGENVELRAFIAEELKTAA